MMSVSDPTICGLYYKHDYDDNWWFLVIKDDSWSEIDDYRVMLQIVLSLTNHNMLEYRPQATHYHGNKTESQAWVYQQGSLW